MSNTPAGKNKAIIAYLTFVGMLIAFFMNKEEKHEFATWHIKNMFGLVVILFISLMFQHYELGFYIYWIAVALWFFSFCMALFNKEQGIPYLSEKFQDWFTFFD
ncbi:MAG: hypothetical protein CMC35_01855 [Flavobacteriaceae bacterium]|nr:hypothetical protein [Flavobacteriaceae bacterium]|tara:strand:+ start:22877 stop:23188 length:312 start_codon:yes stop_codon:yes gene_type:complete